MIDWISPVAIAFHAVAFDLVDTRGRKFPLLLQFRSFGGDTRGRSYKVAGALVSRDSAHTVLATIGCPGQWSAALDMTDESASFFATYAPHRDVEAKDIKFTDPELSRAPFYNAETLTDIGRSSNGMQPGSPEDRKDKWVSLWVAANQPAGACHHALSSHSEPVLVHVTQTRERGHVVFEELRTLCCAAGELWSLEPKELSMFSAYHPPAVVRSFTVAALSPVLLSVPSDVLGIIADYARLELPYVPMSLPFGLALEEWFDETVEDIEFSDVDVDYRAYRKSVYFL